MEIRIGPRKKILKFIEALKSKTEDAVPQKSNDFTQNDLNIEIEEFEIGAPGPSSSMSLQEIVEDNETQANGQGSSSRDVHSKFRLNNVCRYSCKKNLKQVLRRKNAILADKLEKNEELSTRDLRIFKQIIVDDLIITCKNDFYPTSLEKENCAKAIVFNFPSLANSHSSKLPSHVSGHNFQYVY